MMGPGEVRRVIELLRDLGCSVKMCDDGRDDERGGAEEDEGLE